MQIVDIYVLPNGNKIINYNNNLYFNNNLLRILTQNDYNTLNQSLQSNQKPIIIKGSLHTNNNVINIGVVYEAILMVFMYMSNNSVALASAITFDKSVGVSTYQNGLYFPAINWGVRGSGAYPVIYRITNFSFTDTIITLSQPTNMTNMSNDYDMNCYVFFVFT